MTTSWYIMKLFSFPFTHQRLVIYAYYDCSNKTNKNSLKNEKQKMNESSVIFQEFLFVVFQLYIAERGVYNFCLLKKRKKLRNTL